MKSSLLLFFLFALTALTIAAFFTKNKKQLAVVDPAPKNTFPYQANKPSREIELPKKLREISDLAYDDAGGALWAVEDERGILFRMMLPDCSPIDEFPFDKRGDYEGLAMVGNQFFVMESNAQLTQISDATADNPDHSTFKNQALKGNDCEAILYDKNLNRLVIGVKSPKSNMKERAFYNFDLGKMELDENPIFVISIRQIQAFLQENGLVDGNFEDLLKKRARPPSPSAMAIHPITGNYFIIASVGKMLMVTQPDGIILHMIPLDGKIHAQPEGIAFDAKGTMYIANEAAGKVAKIYAFDAIKVD